MLRFPENWLLPGNILILLSVWLLLNCSQTAKAADTVDVVLSQVGSIDVCGEKSDKDIIILVSVGRILQADSLFGFNFEIKYDSVKFKFHSPVYLNTLAEFFDIKDVNFGKKGLVRGYASVGLLGSQISGNRPLIGIYGDYIDNCPDSSEISLNYIEFTDEFKKVIRSNVPTVIQALEVDKPNKFLSTGFELDSITNLEKDSIVELKININQGTSLRLDTAELEIRLDNNEMISVEDIKVSSGLDLISRDNIDKGLIKLKVRFNSITNQYFDLVLKNNENKNDSCRISVNPLSTNYCSCVKRLSGDSIIIRSKEKIDTSTVVWENKIGDETRKIYYDEKSESFQFSFDENIDGYMNLYDLCGSLIYEKKIDWSKEISIEGKYLNKGIYLAIVKSNLKINKIILIKN